MYCPLTTAASERASKRVSHSLAAPDSAVHSFVKIATTTTTAGCGGTGARERERGGTRQRATSIQNRKKKLAQSCTARHPLPLPLSFLPARPLSDRVQESIRQKKRERRTRRPEEADEPCSDGVRARQFWMHGVLRWVEVQPRQKKTTPNARPPMDQPCFPHFIGGTLGGALDSFNNTYEY